MSEKIVTGYSELRILFKEIGIKFTDSGPAEDNLGEEVYIDIADAAIILFFDIDAEGNETFVCQE